MADDINIVTALNLVGNSMKIRSKTSTVIKAKDLKYDPNKKQVIGGDTSDFEQGAHPAIIIEKNGEQMSKIIVRCPCGRHSELLCEYDDDLGPVAEAQVGQTSEVDSGPEAGQAEAEEEVLEAGGETVADDTSAEDQE